MKKAGDESQKNIKKDDKNQSQRFVETAERLETDKSGRAFEQALKAIKPAADHSHPSEKQPAS
jgi:hypothetical protein